MKSQLRVRFHDPNPPAVTAEHLLKLLVEANVPKVEAALRAAQAGPEGGETP